VIQFKKETHEYFVDDIKMPSVTQVISWSLKVDFSYVNEVLLQRATDWGIEVHETTQLIDWEMIDYSTLEGRMLKAAQSWVEFSKDYEILEIEKPYYYEGFCGTIDRVLRHKETGQIYIVDLKTTSTLDRKIGLQLSAYAYLWCQNNDVAWDSVKLMAVQFNKQGLIKTKSYENEWPVFQAMLIVWQWENKFKKGKENE